MGRKSRCRVPACVSCGNEPKFLHVISTSTWHTNYVRNPGRGDITHLQPASSISGKYYICKRCHDQILKDGLELGFWRYDQGGGPPGQHDCTGWHEHGKSGKHGIFTQCFEHSPDSELT